MAKFFEVLKVVEHEGAWTHGPYPTYFYDRAFQSQIVDICNPAWPIVEGEDVQFGIKTLPFAIVGHIKTPTRCEPGELGRLAQEAMAAATEYGVSQVLWYGTTEVDDYDQYLLDPAVTTVTPGANFPATVSKVLAEAYKQTPHLDPVLHLGFEAAMVLQFGLQNLGIPFVVPPGYPTDAVAVTDKRVVVNLSPIASTEAVDNKINRRQIELTRFASIEFDTSKAVRAA